MLKKTIKILTILIPSALSCTSFKQKESVRTNAFSNTSYIYDFESSSEGWTGGTISYTSTYHHHGSKSLKLSHNTTDYTKYLYTSQACDVVPGTYYDVSYWYKSKNATDKPYIQLRLVDTANANNVINLATRTLNGDSTLSSWVKVKNRVLIPSGVTSIKPNFQIFQGSVELYLDDLEIKSVDLDCYDRLTHFEVDDNSNINGWVKDNNIYKYKVTEIEDYNSYNFKINSENSSVLTAKFIDYSGNEIDSFTKNINGLTDVFFKNTSCTYIELSLTSKPTAYSLNIIGSDNLVKGKTGYSTNQGFSERSSAHSLDGESFYVSKYQCEFHYQGNFYFSGLHANGVKLSPEFTYTFSYYFYVDSASNDFSASNIILLRENYASGQGEQYLHWFIDTIDGVSKDSYGNSYADGKWHKVVKTFTPETAVYMQYYWNVVNGKADYYIDKFAIESVKNTAISAHLDYTGEVLDLANGHNYSFTKKETETTSRVENSILYVDDVPTSPIIYLEPNHQDYMVNGAVSNMVKSNLDLYCTYFGGLDLMWTGPSTVDFTEFDKTIYDILRNGSDVRVMVNFGLFAPKWWIDANPNEAVIIYTDANTSSKPEDNFKRTYGVSFSSKKFREEAADIFEIIFNHMKQQDYYNSIFGFKISAGRTYEWMNYGFGSDQGQNQGDYSSCSIIAFKEYLEQKYSVISTLNTTWGTSYSSFNDILPPTFAERTGYSEFPFYKKQKFIDWNLFLSDEASNTFIEFAKLTKKLSNNNKIVGGYNGYVWLGGGYNMVGTAHTTFNKVITSPYIDFVASPLAYGERVLGTTSAFMTLNDTVRANGKIYILEDDNRTSYRNVYGGDESDSLNTALGVAYTGDETIKYQKADFINEFVNGAGMWYYDMTGNWFDNDQYYQMLQLEKQEMDKSLESNVDYVNDIAVFVDEENASYISAKLDAGTDQLFTPSFVQQRKELMEVGTGYDVYSLSSLKEGKVPNHKVNIFLSTIIMHDDDVAAVNTYLKKNNNYVIFTGPCGYSNGSSWSVNNITNLVGMKIATESKSRGMQVNITNSNISSNEVYGSYGTTLDIATKVSDSSASTWGKNKNWSYSVGLAYKNMESWHSVYSCAPALPASVIRYVCKQAGVHLYSESKGDLIYSNSHYVGVTSSFTGNHTINLEKEYRVFDVFKNKYISNTPVSSFTDFIEKDDSKLYRLEDSTYKLVVNNGSGSGSYEYGSSVTLTAQNKQYYTFEGFYSGNTLLSSNSSYTFNITEDMDITLKYKPTQFKIQFKDGNQIVQTIFYDADNSTIIEPSAPSYENYDCHWEDYELFSSETIVVNLIKQEHSKYNVNFYDENNILKTISVYSGNKIDQNLLPSTNKDGYIFEGWIANGEPFDLNTPITSDLDLHAKYRKSVEMVTVTFETDGGGNINPINIEKGTNLSNVSISLPSKEGYSFVGWYYNGTMFDVSNTVINEDITLYASYIKNKTPKEENTENKSLIFRFGCKGSITTSALCFTFALFGLFSVSLKKKFK